MASEYIRLQIQDSPDKGLTPDDGRQQKRTAKERIRNWWDYHWKLVVIAVLIGAAALSMLLHNLGITEPLPDYQVAYVGTGSLSDETVERITELFRTCGEDATGDEVVTVKIHQYVLYEDTQDYDMRRLTDAALTALEGDLATQTSYFFLLEDPNMFTDSYQALAEADGSIPEEGDMTWEDKVWLLSDVAQDVPEEDGGLYLGRRVYYGEQTVKYKDACDRLWDTLAASTQRAFGTSAAETESD